MTPDAEAAARAPAEGAAGAEAAAAADAPDSAAPARALEAPALESLAALVEGRIEPEQWTATMTADQAALPRRYPRGVTKARL